MKRPGLVVFSTFCIVFGVIAAMGHEQNLFVTAWVLGGIAAGVWAKENWVS